MAAPAAAFECAEAPSLARLLRCRELSGPRAWLDQGLSLGGFKRGEFACCSCTVNNPAGLGSPPFAAAFNRVYSGGRLLAIGDEEGYVTVLNTSTPLPSSTGAEAGARPAAQWLAHRNAVFDLAWAAADARMLVASGDQSVSLWDTSCAAPICSFLGHSGSVKAVAPCAAAPEVFASGARDGCLALWDARCGAKGGGGGGARCHASPVLLLPEAHARGGEVSGRLASGKRAREPRERLAGEARVGAPPVSSPPTITPLRPTTPRRTPRRRAGGTEAGKALSVTSLSWLPGDLALASGGVDGTVKLWDLRCVRGSKGSERALATACTPSFRGKRHGVTSLSLHPDGSQLLVSLTGGRLLVYDACALPAGPRRWLGGHVAASFYVKAAWSPDGLAAAAGSSDHRLCVWPGAGCAGGGGDWEAGCPGGLRSGPETLQNVQQPWRLEGHQGEVMAVAWCAADPGLLASCADDAGVRLWRWTPRPGRGEEAGGGCAQEEGEGIRWRLAAGALCGALDGGEAGEGVVRGNATLDGIWRRVEECRRWGMGGEQRRAMQAIGVEEGEWDDKLGQSSNSTTVGERRIDASSSAVRPNALTDTLPSAQAPFLREERAAATPKHRTPRPQHRTPGGQDWSSAVRGSLFDWDAQSAPSAARPSSRRRQSIISQYFASPAVVVAGGNRDTELLRDHARPSSDSRQEPIPEARTLFPDAEAGGERAALAEEAARSRGQSASRPNLQPTTPGEPTPVANPAASLQFDTA